MKVVALPIFDPNQKLPYWRASLTYPDLSPANLSLLLTIFSPSTLIFSCHAVYVAVSHVDGATEQHTC